ncbi:hypothetical protein, partial [Stenotrophomonas sp. SrG]|uniref:hypothetical protein n=1 Tax=Stenotrophomonas sp. SrG TaxID=3414430 RepID=UPI003CF4DCA4
LVVLRAGVPVDGEAAAVQDYFDINTIGWVSLAAVLLLVWVAFRSLRPMLGVAAARLGGWGGALGVSVLGGGRVAGG